MPHPFNLTPEFVISLKPCWTAARVRAAFDGRQTVLLSDAVADPSLDADDALWLGCCALWEIDRPTARRFAVVVARWASVRIAERDTIETPNGPRWQGKPTPVTRVTWRHIHGTATDEQLDAARAATWDATWAATWDAATWDAARAATWDAIRAHLVRMIRRAEKLI